MSLSLCEGESLGIAGVQGNGQSELLEVIAGLRRPASGTVRFASRDVTSAPPGDRRALGMGFIPEDRLARGTIPDFTLAENLILGRQSEFSGSLLLDRAAIFDFARRILHEKDVRPADPNANAGSLSGGNQQKLILARECSRQGLRLLVCAQPTRGVDLRGTERIRGELRTAKEAGVALLLVSTELEELRSLCDRIAVMVRGQIVAVLTREEASDTELGALMTGARGGRV